MLLIGKIIGTKGLKGEVKIYPYTNSLEDFDRIKSVYLNGDMDKKLIFKKQKMKKNLILAFFEGIDNIDQAEEIKNTEIYLSETGRIEFLSNDSYFYEDIIGIEVFSTKGKSLGFIQSVTTSTKQDVLVIKNKDKEWMLPNVPYFVKNIDLENKKIVVDLIEGLVDED